MSEVKQATISFKAEESLVDILRMIPNRSEFIREAILSALDNVCPLCRGTGILNPKQKSHWEQFAADHPMAECHKCNEWYPVCSHQASATPHEEEE
ncbi:MAG: CopG family transcriptional regulator [Phycisphaerales bacterium]|nr:CopG family transcriptional regulator [Phycisphaerales bacterium]